MLEFLQVLSRGDDKFQYILNSHADYEDWIEELEEATFTTFAPLPENFYSITNLIAGDQMRPMEDATVIKMVRKQYNLVLIAMLRASLPEVFRRDISKMDIT